MDFFGIPITVPTPRYIGDIVPQITLEEVGNDEVVITDHPVEQSAMISDHAYKRPAELVMRCGWTNSSFAAGGDEGFVSRVYEELLAVQAQLQPLAVSTGKRLYQNMMLVGVHLVTDEKTETSLMVIARLREVIIVQVTTSNLPPVANMRAPQNTAPVVDGGNKSLLTPAVPAPGGALPIPAPVSTDIVSSAIAGIY